MADAPVVHIGENSPEKIAYDLMICISHNEGKSLHSGMGSKASADRKWLLNTYAECLLAVRNPLGHLAGNHDDVRGQAKHERDDIDM